MVHFYRTDFGVPRKALLTLNALFQHIVPVDYDDQLAYYTHKGYRVIGCAARHIPKLSWVKAQKMKRHEAESQLEFTGFIIFENKLKPTTAPVLTELLESNISTTMVTGDNILTAISVARECNLINKTAHCFVPRFIEGEWRQLRHLIDSNSEQATPVTQRLGYGGRALTTEVSS